MNSATLPSAVEIARIFAVRDIDGIRSDAAELGVDPLVLAVAGGTLLADEVLRRIRRCIVGNCQNEAIGPTSICSTCAATTRQRNAEAAAFWGGMGCPKCGGIGDEHSHQLPAKELLARRTAPAKERAA